MTDGSLWIGVFCPTPITMDCIACSVNDAPSLGRYLGRYLTTGCTTCSVHGHKLLYHIIFRVYLQMHNHF